ncbi:energy transducer TonB [Hymenobacter sp. PAMC 26628]|uniref:energy transducer TonB n=1 Tax=Hymenobacter sp. PAMC 26628 TaxID=1484118 RepID=UPI0012FFC08C|nr:energy transducer TonB [Hymenobacter sp. PAMC 26628]
MPTFRLLLPLLVAWGLGGAARAQTTPAPAFPQTTVAYLDADERPLPGPDSAAYRVETLRTDSSSRAVVRRYYATGALQAYTPYLDLGRGVVHGTRTTWYEDGRPCTKEEYLGGRRQGELLAYYPDGTLKRRDQFVADQNMLGACYGPDGRPVPYFPYEQPPLYPGGALLLYHDVTRRVRPTATEMHRFDTSGSLMWEGAFGGARRETRPAVVPGATRWPVGQIDVVFTITEQGEVADPYVARSSAPWLNEKVLAAVRGLTKRFRPGQRDGQTVRATCQVPVVFYVRPASSPGRRL